MVIESDQIADEVAEKLDANAALHWDNFYRSNSDRFFKDRHYLHREFPLLMAPGIAVLEVRPTSTRTRTQR
jgi:hypothetical protein